MTCETLPDRFTPRFLDRLDGRTQAARILRQRLAELQSDLGGDLSYQQASLTKRCIWLESWIETQEAKAAEGEDVSIGQQVQALNSLLGLYRTLGLERKAREVPDLASYLAKKASDKDNANE
jgi:hypothetical protein